MRNCLTVLGLMSLCSCGIDPGSGDYDYALPGDFSVRSTSAHQIEIASQSAMPGVPPRVIEIGWDKRFIIAKQQFLKDRGDFPGDNYQVPVPGKYQFWIIDVVTTNRVGPLDEKELAERRSALGIPGTIKMKSPAAVGSRNAVTH
jgi:hypothetical protein